MTLRGAVVGCVPTAAGPKGRARCRNESASTIIAVACPNSVMTFEIDLLVGKRRRIVVRLIRLD